jgi:hypothetical protein
MSRGPYKATVTKQAEVKEAIKTAELCEDVIAAEVAMFCRVLNRYEPKYRREILQRVSEWNFYNG